ncbi:Integrase catalytic domain-containing protein [Meloidogyne graminicola]|uniref:Integrase catalytic domain-containing protein n=1 Tax=Meloidogyne graminicola TaxID=189291 RepID=A0A8S9ZEL5_9BILA|nr:Integrase catalytic domain-containing protein [Meloidogyne graminicola]
MAEDIKKYIKSCDSCQRTKDEFHPKHEELYPIKKPNFPFQHLHVDIIGPIVTSNRGSKYILSIIDSFSKYLICWPLKDQTAPVIMRIIVDHVITKFGTPKYITSDQGRNFTSQIMKDISRIFGFEQIFTVSYYQSANGQVERANRIIKSILANYVDREGKYKIITLFILFGREMELPIDIVMNLKPKESGEEENNNTLFYENLKNKVQNIWSKTVINIEKAQEKQKQNYDKNINPSDYKVGDLVLKKVEVPLHKFSKKFEGPFEIISLNKPNVVIKVDEKIIETHLDKLKLFNNKSSLELRENNKKIKYKDKNVESEESERE